MFHIEKFDHGTEIYFTLKSQVLFKVKYIKQREAIKQRVTSCLGRATTDTDVPLTQKATGI